MEYYERYERLRYDTRTNSIIYNYVSYDVYYSSILAKTKEKTSYKTYGVDETTIKG